jgi:hypothetical protein
MTHAIDTVFIDAILVPLLRELGLPETRPLAKLSPRMQKWVPGEAACLQRDDVTLSARADQVRLEAVPLVGWSFDFALSSGLLPSGGVSQPVGLGVVLTTDMGYGEGKRPCQLLAGPIKGIETRAAAGVCARHLSDHDLGIRVDMKDRGVERQSALKGLEQRHVFRYIVVLMTNPFSNSNLAAVRTVDHHPDSGRPRVAQRTAVNIGYKR